ncbi:MAG: radical SAM protein [Treponema sp.]|nr:radical SAM protein [Treponema sp.]
MCPILIYTLGCKLNQLESEAIADSFRKAGFSLVAWGAVLEGPGLVIINTCTVTSKADQKARRTIRKALRENPRSCVIAVGCYAQLDPGDIALLESESAPEGCPESPHGRRLFVLGGGTGKGALLKLPGYLLGATAGTLAEMLESWLCREEGSSPFDFRPGEFAFHSRGYLKIQDGCDSACTYCRVRLARGPSVSLDRKTALAELLAYEARGCAELMITGVNISQYRHSDCDLAGLVEYLLEGSEAIALRLSSLEPEAVDERLASALAHPRVRPHFHLCVQSGSAEVLEKMGRVYDPRRAEEAAALLRSAKDNPFLACDIIAGFPGETGADFARTLAFCEKNRFAWIHAFPFSKRPGTAAFAFGGSVCERDVTRRVEALTSLALRGRRDYAQAWLGRELSAVVEKGEPAQKGEFRAVSENYLKLAVRYSGEAPPPGSVVKCVVMSLCDGADGDKPDATAEQVTGDN